MPIERPPHGVSFPQHWNAKLAHGRPYHPGDKPVQEDWQSVARKFGVGVIELIYFNFGTNDPDEVNWYLHHYTGFKKPSPSGNNWMFHNDADPGIIFIPPPADTQIDFKPEENCLWTPTAGYKFLMRLLTVSQTTFGNKGQRIRKLMGVIMRAGYPGCMDLWYYNSMNISEYVDIKTDPAKLREMTKATRRTFPFDGESGLHRQSGTEEQRSGKWRIHAVKDLFDGFACGVWKPDRMKSDLENIDADMYKGWHAMDLVGAIGGGAGGGNAWADDVYQFINHVGLLAKDNTHLYSAFP